MFRSKELCPDPPNCPEVLTEEPDAGPFALPCDGCPRQALEDYLASPAGRLISSVIDIDRAIQMGITVTLEELPSTVFVLLCQLDEERKRFESEEIKRNSQRGRQ